MHHYNYTSCSGKVDKCRSLLSIDRKRFTDKENQSVLKKLRDEMKTLNPAVSTVDIRGDQSLHANIKVLWNINVIIMS